MRAPNPEIYAPGVALGGAPLGGQVAGNRDEYLGLIDGLLDVQSLGGAAALRVHNVSCRVRAALAPRPPPTPRHALRRPAPAPAPVPAPVPTFAPAPTFAPPAESRWKLRTQPFLLLLRRMPVLCLGFQRHPVRIKEVLMIACCVLALRDTP